jgi:hypothetical protein
MFFICFPPKYKGQHGVLQISNFFVQKALLSVKKLKAHHPKDYDIECSNKMSIHFKVQKKYYPKDDATMDVKCVPQHVLGDETTPIVVSTFDQFEKIDLLITCLLSKACLLPST